MLFAFLHCVPLHIILLGRDMVACMQYALPYEWNNRTKQTSFLRSGIFPFKANVMQKNDGDA